MNTRLRRLQVDPVTDPYHDALTVAAQHRPDATPGTDTDLCQRLEWWR